MRFGIITDVHLVPADSGPLSWHNAYAVTDTATSWHNAYAVTDTATRFREALARCVAADVDAIAVLGDLSNDGDDASLDDGVWLAAASGRPVWIVPGNHDVITHADALAAAVARADAGAVRLAPPGGVPLGDGVRLAGLAALTRDQPPKNTAVRAAAPLPVPAWGDDLVLLLAHYPLLSLVARAADAGFKYAGDLADLDALAAPLVRRAAPTVVAHGHLHLRDASSVGRVLQLSCAALIEPPFEVTLLDIARHGGRATARRASTPVAPSSDVRLPVLAPPDGAWAFEAGAWRALEQDDDPTHGHPLTPPPTAPRF